MRKYIIFGIRAKFHLNLEPLCIRVLLFPKHIPNAIPGFDPVLVMGSSMTLE